MPIDLNEHLKRKNANNNKPNNGSGGDKNNGGDKDSPNPFKPPKINMPEMPNGKTLTGIIVAVVIVFILIIAKPFVIINSGEVGIKSTAGKYNFTPLQAGLHFFIPWIQNVIIVDTRVRTINFSRKIWA